VFVYADENVQKDEHAEMFRGYVVTRLATKEDGSILMAAPTYGFTAYSQIYADLIAQINAHYRMSRRTELMEEFLTQAAAMHLWSLPYVKAIEWQTIKDRLEAEARMLQSV